MGFGPGGFTTGTAAVDPPSINAGATADIVLTVEEAREGMIAIPSPPDSLEAALVPIAAWVTAHKSLTLRLLNDSGGAVDGASRSWGFLLFSGGSMPFGGG